MINPPENDWRKGGDFPKKKEEEFRTMYMCEPWDSDEDLKLRELARQYHERCDAYDETLGKPYELYRALSYKHARQVDEELSQAAARLGFSNPQWVYARSKEADRRREK